MRFWAVILLTFLICSKAASQDSLKLELNDFTFKTEFEKKALQDFLASKQVSPLVLLSATDKNITEEKLLSLEKRVKDVIQKLKSKNLDKLSEKKKVSTVYEAVHAEFFKKYEENCNFLDFQLNGTYNCVTASALYAVIFEELSIPYQLKELPSHVYIQAFPRTSKIVVESTTPATPVFTYSDQAKVQMLEYLKKQKLISEEEYRNTPKELLFEKYINKSEDISLLNLVGILYNNQAYFLAQDFNYADASRALDKGFLFFSDKKIKFFRASAYITAVKNLDFNSVQDFRRYALQYKAAPELFNEKAVLAVCGLAIQKFGNEKDRPKLDSVFNLMSIIGSDDTKQKIGYYQMLFKFDEAKSKIDRIREAYKLAGIIVNSTQVTKETKENITGFVTARLNFLSGIDVTANAFTIRAEATLIRNHLSALFTESRYSAPIFFKSVFMAQNAYKADEGETGTAYLQLMLDLLKRDSLVEKNASNWFFSEKARVSMMEKQPIVVRFTFQREVDEAFSECIKFLFRKNAEAAFEEIIQILSKQATDERLRYRIQRGVMFAYAQACNESIEKQNLTKAYAFLGKFENMLNIQPMLATEHGVVDVYRDFWTYYIQKSQYSMAQAVLSRAEGKLQGNTEIAEMKGKTLDFINTK
jgi:hypothetical protein